MSARKRMIRIGFSFLGLFLLCSAVVVWIAVASSPTCSHAVAKGTHDSAQGPGSADFFDPDGDCGSGEIPDPAQAANAPIGRWGSAPGEPGSSSRFEQDGTLYPHIPVTNPQPPSTLLPPGTGALSLTVQSSANTTCAFSMGTARPYDAMTPFDRGAGTTVHTTTLSSLDPDPNVVNNIYVRCASDPDYLLPLKYRSLSQADPSYPRTGNLWGWWDLLHKGLPSMARIDLWLGADHATPDDIRELRLLNPDIRILTDINAVDNANLPDDYYLKDIHGNRLEVWPNSYRLNLTKPYVAEYQAYSAYQRMLDKDLMFNGVFFDSVFTTQSGANMISTEPLFRDC